jgi:alpha/beta superfamily hydrolase
VISDRLTIESTDDLTLEAVLDQPHDPQAALVLCHPHPQMGGTMNAPLLVALRDHLVARGWAVLRFNFRGIGQSEGDSSTGEDEVADALGAVTFVKKRLQSMPIAIAGWSFGAAVAVRAAMEDDSLIACVGIAPSIRPKEGVTAGLPDVETIDLGVPLLLVCATNDELVDVQDCRAWADGIPHARVMEIRGANHFFWAKYDLLASTVTDFLDECARPFSETRGG